MRCRSCSCVASLVIIFFSPARPIFRVGHSSHRLRQTAAPAGRGMGKKCEALCWAGGKRRLTRMPIRVRAMRMARPHAFSQRRKKCFTGSGKVGCRVVCDRWLEEINGRATRTGVSCVRGVTPSLPEAVPTVLHAPGKGLCRGPPPTPVVSFSSSRPCRRRKRCSRCPFAATQKSSVGWTVEDGDGEMTLRPSRLAVHPPPSAHGCPRRIGS